MNTITLIFIHLAAVLLITRIPFLKDYFSLWNTIIQEVTHGLVGRVSQKDNKRTSKQGMVTYLGFTNTLIAAIGLFYLLSKGSYHFILYLLMAVLVLALLFWIRNFKGFIWVLSSGVLLALPIYYNQEIVIIHLSMFLSSLILVQAIINAFNVFCFSFKSNIPEGKSAFFVKLAKIPAVIFGMVLLAQSLFAVYIIAKHILNLKPAMIRFDWIDTIQIVERFFS